VDGGGLPGGRFERGVSHAPLQIEVTSKNRTLEFAASQARIAVRMVALRCSHCRSDGMACCQRPKPPRRDKRSSGKRGMIASHNCGSNAQAIPPLRPSSCEPLRPALQRTSSGSDEKMSEGLDCPTAQPQTTRGPAVAWRRSQRAACDERIGVGRRPHVKAIGRVETSEATAQREAGEVSRRSRREMPLARSARPAVGRRTYGQLTWCMVKAHRMLPTPRRATSPSAPPRV
jgi:hypothetical protein